MSTPPERIPPPPPPDWRTIPPAPRRQVPPPPPQPQMIQPPRPSAFEAIIAGIQLICLLFGIVVACWFLIGYMIPSLF